MSGKLAVVCPQCKLRLQVEASEQKKVISCPDCEMQFKIGAVTQTVVAEKIVQSESSFSASNSSSKVFNSGLSNPTPAFRNSRDHQAGGSRAGRYAAGKRRAKQRTEVDELLQSVGFFLVIMAAFSAILPFFDLHIGEFSLPGSKVMWLALMVGLIGTVMLVVSNRHNPMIALGSGIGLLLVVMVVWIANMDLSNYTNALRPATTNIAQAEDDAGDGGQIPNANDQSVATGAVQNPALNPALVNANNGTRNLPSGMVGGTSTNNAQSKRDGVMQIPMAVEGGTTKPDPIDDELTRSRFDKISKASSGLPGSMSSSDPNESLSSSTQATSPEKERIENAQRGLRRELGFSPTGIDPEALDRFTDKKIELEKRFKSLFRAGIINGKSDSTELTTQYSWTSIGGREAVYGDALYDDKPMKGLDVMSSGKFFKKIIPIKERRRYSTSLYRNDSSYVCGLNLNVVDGEILGIQVRFAPMAQDRNSLATSTTYTTRWIGTTPRIGETTMIGGDRIVYGVVAYVDVSRIVGIRLIVKK